MKKILRNMLTGFGGAIVMCQFRIVAQANSVPEEIIFQEDGLAPLWEELCLLLPMVWKDAVALFVAMACMICMFLAARKQKKRNR